MDSEIRLGYLVKVRRLCINKNDRRRESGISEMGINSDQISNSPVSEISNPLMEVMINVWVRRRERLGCRKLGVMTSILPVTQQNNILFSTNETSNSSSTTNQPTNYIGLYNNTTHHGLVLITSIKQNKLNQLLPLHFYLDKFKSKSKRIF